MTKLTEQCERCGRESFDVVAGECWNCLHQDGISPCWTLTLIVAAWAGTLAVCVGVYAYLL
jgi:hypothetical protein